jgi:hypothetical protein
MALVAFSGVVIGHLDFLRRLAAVARLSRHIRNEWSPVDSNRIIWILPQSQHIHFACRPILINSPSLALWYLCRVIGIGADMIPVSNWLLANRARKHHLIYIPWMVEMRITIDDGWFAPGHSFRHFLNASSKSCRFHAYHFDPQ